MAGKNEMDIYLFHKGEHRRAYEYMGAHRTPRGTIFRVWAPNASSVRVIGDFNSWNNQSNFMNKITDEGIWETEIKDAPKGSHYKYAVQDHKGNIVEKSDPYGFYGQKRPETASVVYSLNKYRWGDKKWIGERDKNIHHKNPMNIYEVHLGSWKRTEDGDFMNYRDIADDMAKYVVEMGYTHVEIMPVNEHPLDDSWGYQATGYFAVTSRYGDPEDFRYFVNLMHKNGIGVILDWVPGHFCKDSHGLYRFDGTPTYEYSWELLGENYDWGTANFDLSRHEVRTFLISNALYWMREFHIDGLRVDAVANMLYLDYGKSGHPELKNYHGGNENLWAVEFFKQLNSAISEEFPGNYVFAEESTAWPKVTGSIEDGGLGFDYKWNMGWMNDTLAYMEKDPCHRKWHHGNLTFSFMYVFSENYALPLSHDEVVHGKKSLLGKMPGEYDQKFDNLRVLYGYKMGTPGKKLLFMGGEFAQHNEWKFAGELDWDLLQYEKHQGMQRYVRDLNMMYKDEKPFWEIDTEDDTFKWIECDNEDESVIAFIRKAEDEDDFIVGVFNFTPMAREGYRVGVPKEGVYSQILNSDLKIYGGHTENLAEGIASVEEKHHEMEHHIDVTLPPMSVIYYKRSFR